MTRQPRVLVLLGNQALYGKERANIQVFKVLRDIGVDALFVTDEEWGHLHIQPALEADGFAWAPARTAGPLRLSKGQRPSVRLFTDIVAGWRDLWRIVQDYGPTHIHAPNVWQYVYNLPVLMRMKVPVVYRLGDAPEGGDPSRGDRVYRAIWRRFIIPTVDQFVCVSHYIQDRLIEAGASPKQVRVIHTFPPERALQASDLPDDLARERNGETPAFSGRTVVYMGQIAKHKGVGLLVDAALDVCCQREDVRFLIAGSYDASSPFVRSITERIEHRDLTDQIRLLGYIQDIPGLLELADVHTAPSVWEEPLANTVPEAKRAGVPTVLFPSGGLPELVVTHGQDAYLCPEKTAEALADGFRHYLSMDADELATASHQACMSLYTLGITRDAFTQAWADVYSSI